MCLAGLETFQQLCENIDLMALPIILFMFSVRMHQMLSSIKVFHIDRLPYLCVLTVISVGRYVIL